MKHWVIEFRNEWKQLFGEWNWYSFTLVYIYFEKSYHGYEFWFTLLGLGFYLRYNTDKSFEQFAEWDEEMTEPMSLEEWKRATLEDLEKHL